MNKLQKILTLMAMSLAAGAPKVCAHIDMAALALIESGNNPNAYNKKTKATGLYQITPICLKEFNRKQGKSMRFTMREMMNPMKAEVVARWYLGDRIVPMLGWMGLPVTTQRVLWAWNAGIGRVADGIMPEETREFINRYNQIARRTDEDKGV